MSRYFNGLPTWKDSRPILFRLLIMCTDALSVGVAYSLAYYLRFLSAPIQALFPATKGIPPFYEYVHTGPVVLFMWVLSFSWHGGYSRIQMPALDEAIRVFRGAFLGTLMSMSALFLYRDISYSRLVFVTAGFLGLVLVYLSRQSLKILYLHWIRLNRRHPVRVLILGDGYLSVTLKKILEKHRDKAILQKKYYPLEEAKKTILRSRISEVLIANPEIDHKDVIQLAGFCEDHFVKCRLIPNILELRMGEVVIDESLGLPTFQLKPVSLHGSSFLAKRIVDVAISSFLLGLFFIPIAIIGLLIKLTSKGPVFYHHDRVGFRGRTFQFMKFRSMVPNADALLESLKSQSDRQGPVFKMKSDPRITWIGKYLRRYSMDELPQLINVLRGEMSLMGPRPQVLWEAKVYDDWARKRLNVLPGITGLWQVSGRAELTYEEMIELDIYYIEHWSLGLDLKILLKTIPAIFAGEGAY